MPKKQEKSLENRLSQGFSSIAGMGFEPHDLRVMSFTSHGEKPVKWHICELLLTKNRLHGIITVEQICRVIGGSK